MTENVYTALAKAQAQMGPVYKGAINPHFKSKYADLADVMQVAIPALSENGIAVYHAMEGDGNGGLYMTTVLVHGASETRISCQVPLIVQKNDMQGMKSATTYAKRIGIESLTGIAPDDDDGNAAASAAPKKMSAAQAKKDHWPQFNRALQHCADRQDLETIWRVFADERNSLPDGYVQGCIEAFQTRAAELGEHQEAAE